ncbi:hypothetical protein FB45DRAFT_1037500 [Roridomyces roridus]|uniref:Transmembrane protein n=1 Tax=Roridomyces roridus TaxID=1738132 RepID=A0AAD7F9U0_9AGAR|nr:hypothetical protein FB45DRAFT_1037500 [Roridomyces roridus]
MPASRTAAIHCLIVVFSFVLLAALPYILGAFPQTAAAAPRRSCAVVGLVSTFVNLYIFLRRCFSSVRLAQRTPSPAALEEGTASPVDPDATPKSERLSSILNAITSALLPFNYFLSHGTLSLDKPLLVNVADFAMFLIDGLESIAVIVVLVCLGAKVYQVFRPSTTTEEEEGKEEEAVGEKHAPEKV